MRCFVKVAMLLEQVLYALAAYFMRPPALWHHSGPDSQGFGNIDGA